MSFSEKNTHLFTTLGLHNADQNLIYMLKYMQEHYTTVTMKELSIAAIAEELGYSDASNFRAVFKKYFGCTPQEYRQNL